MVIAPILALLIGGGIPPAQSCTAGSEFEPPVCAAQLPGIRSVVITANGITAWTDSEEANCATFKLSDRQVRTYLTHAGKVDAQAAHHTLSESPCQATGTVRFTDGSSGTWWIDRYRRGGLTRPGQPDMMLYCPRCRTKPFAW
jgi:hypothetical protein